MSGVIADRQLPAVKTFAKTETSEAKANSKVSQISPSSSEYFDNSLNSLNTVLRDSSHSTADKNLANSSAAGEQRNTKIQPEIEDRLDYIQSALSNCQQQVLGVGSLRQTVMEFKTLLKDVQSELLKIQVFTLLFTFY